jgi:hypothetical protein
VLLCVHRQREQQATEARKAVGALLQEFKKQEAKLKSVTDKISDQVCVYGRQEWGEGGVRWFPVIVISPTPRCVDSAKSVWSCAHTGSAAS